MPTPDEYRRSNDPAVLLTGVRCTPRQLNLICCRLAEGLRPDFFCHRLDSALDLYWKYADRSDQNALWDASNVLMRVYEEYEYRLSADAPDPASDAFLYLQRLDDVFRGGASWRKPPRKATRVLYCSDLTTHLEESRPRGSWSAVAVGDSIRDILGDPFSPLVVAQSKNPDVKSVACAIHTSGDQSQLPILADALEDADYKDDGVLSMLRSGVKRFPGWAVFDAILGLPPASAYRSRPLE